MKILSIAVPCYNSEAYMEICIESLLTGGEEVEILVVNDGSSDRTAEIADAYAEKYPTIIKAIHQENGGHGEAVNAGIRNATGLFFKVVDSDDWVDYEAYMKILKKLRELAGGDTVLDMFIANYVYEKELDTQFLLATANHVQDFSIGEITDKKIEKRGEDFYLVSKSYHLDIKITDDEVLTAAINGLYISAFISRKDDNYRVHFLVHQYPDQMKARCEEKITKDVVDYMIYGTIQALRLDTPEKVNAYLGI